LTASPTSCLNRLLTFIGIRWSPTVKQDCPSFNRCWSHFSIIPPTCTKHFPTVLNRFYEDNVKMTKEETKRNVDIVMPLVNDILTYVHQRDERFKIQSLHVGSYYSHLKVSVPLVHTSDGVSSTTL
jgi:hypothetical protein